MNPDASNSPTTNSKSNGSRLIKKKKLIKLLINCEKLKIIFSLEEISPVRGTLKKKKKFQNNFSS